MKKKIIVVVMAMFVVMLLTACQKKEEVQKTEKNVEKKEQLLEITLPSSFFDEEGMSEINQKAKENGVKEITVNDDGSVTYKMTKAAHEALLKEVKISVDGTIKEMLEDKTNYPSYSEITYNEGMTEFEIKVDQAVYTTMESFGVLPLYIGGGLYQLMNQVPEEEINTKVSIVNKDTEEVLESGDSASMAQEYMGE